MRKLFAAIVFLFVLPGVSHAADRYVLDGGTSSTCLSWSDACDQVSTAESLIARGETIWVGDGSYNSVTFNVPASSTTTIAIKKATVSDHGTETGWDNAYGDGEALFAAPITFASSYWIMDGQYRASSTSGYGFRIKSECPNRCISLTSEMDHLTFKYIHMQGGGPDGDCVGGANSCVYSNPGPVTYVTMQYCYFHDVGSAHLIVRNADNWTIEYSYFTLNESVPAEHAEPLSIGDSSNWIFRYNTVNDTEGTCIIASLDVDPGPVGWEIYGNVFSNFQSSNSAIGNDSESTWTSSKVYNNTFINGTGSNGIEPLNGSGSGWEVYNNIWYNCQSVDFTTPHDYNASDDDLSEAHDQTISSSIFTNYAGGDFTLSAATNAGTTLASPYDQDCLDGSCTTRGADGTWDRGAYEFTAGTSISGVGSISGITLQ